MREETPDPTMQTSKAHTEANLAILKVSSVSKSDCLHSQINVGIYDGHYFQNTFFDFVKIEINFLKILFSKTNMSN